MQVSNKVTFNNDYCKGEFMKEKRYFCDLIKRKFNKKEKILGKSIFYITFGNWNSSRIFYLYYGNYYVIVYIFCCNCNFSYKQNER